MSGAQLSFILYSRLYLVRGLLITVLLLVITSPNVCFALSHQLCHSMTSSSSLKTSNWFTLFSLFQHTPSGSGRADTNPLLSCLHFFYSIPLDVRSFWKSSFGAISSLTFCTLAIFSPFDIPIMRSLNSKNFFPWSGFFVKSATILLVWHYSNPMSLFSIRSWMKKYLILMCFFRIELDARPFFSVSIALMLSWYSVDFFTSKPWLWRNAFFHKTYGDASQTPTSSLIVELVALIFYFFYALMTQPFLMEIVSPVCPFKSGWVPYDSSIY